MKAPRTAKLVLIVDDDDDTRTIYGGILARHGYEVLTATQGAEGVHMARGHSPDLVLMDVHMPVMDGCHAAWYLKSDPLTSQIPICGLSAYYSEVEARQQAHAESFDCLLPKPPEPAKVVRTVESMIGPPGLWTDE